MKYTLDSKGKQYAKFPSDPIIRGSFYKLRKEYSKLCKLKHRQFKEKLIEKLDNLHENNPKEYWKLFNSLKNYSFDSPESQITNEEWVKHFKTLNMVPDKLSNRLSEIENILKEEEKIKYFNSLDFKIGENEISKAINALKCGKSAGLNGIMNEIIKISKEAIQPCLYKFFNSIFSTSIYPECWCFAFIKPIFKSKDPTDPSNYRGITVMNCFAKLYNKILNNRFEDFLDKNNIIVREQIGFQRKSRTSDHMFVLKTLIDKVTDSNNGKLFSCFVDFRKAFDTVVHPALFLKLLKLGIGSLFYKSLKAMYHHTSLRVKVNDKLTPAFNSNIGVRQGDTISPNLFKVFINDLPSIFDNFCDPIILNNLKLNCLMFADDVVLFSESESGLQNALNKLAKYCDDWCLTLNLDKTKVIIFSKSGRLIKRGFVFNNKTIECVQSYKYLGVIFTASGTFSQAKKDLSQRAMKGLFKLKSGFAILTPKITSSLHIFDHTLKYSLVYGCEVWGVPSFKKGKNEFSLEQSFENF